MIIFLPLAVTAISMFGIVHTYIFVENNVKLIDDISKISFEFGGLDSDY